ncbi:MULTISPECIES: hypothetical protein [Sphingobium]|uniref:hypothetical protein n=1 Tax=Sphingobium TaxID=165695 RepID=UPI00031CC26D|nr:MULTISPECIES: hypothetical protein [Sphingobium]MBV2148530.1 hypothetical protein [Sphingobium sp. AS12]QWT14902.1 hypothetical protein GTV57_03800 [Sphingobium xenophagum]|tara:strand:- start:28 stop:186 length:159 start_codon:yes stop_codon:yes gene_type:complete
MRRVSPSSRLRSLAREVGRLHPDWQNPERYFERRDELRREIAALATDMEAGR